MAERKRRDRPARPSVRQTEGTIRVSSTRAPGEPDENEVREIEVRRFETEPAYVRINAGVTKNLGNYESFRVDVSITMPCYVEELEGMTDAVSDRVADRLEDELKKWNIEEG